MWLHRCGYHPPHETVACHARRRFRLTPSKTPNPALPPPDPSLWIVHYSKSPSIDQIPVAHIAVSPTVHNILAQRRFLQGQGQLARKEFMLHDRNNWPTISLPPQVGQQHYAQPNPYAPQYMPRQPQPTFFQQAPGAAIPGPVKAPRGHRTSAASAMAGAAIPDFSLDEEEVSTGDFLDHITPREISRLRYRHNHEWMEEIFDSPYRINQILPVELGLGRKGELESLTKDYLNAPTGPASESNGTVVGKMDSEKMEEFTKAVHKKVADVTAEIEAMKRKHNKRLEKMKRLDVLKEGERKLRDAYVDPSNTGTEFWRIEGRLRPLVVKEDAMEQVEPTEVKPKTRVADLTAEVEKEWGEPIVPQKEVVCVDKGGYLEPVNEPPKPNPQPRRNPPPADIAMGYMEDVSRTMASPTIQPQPGAAVPSLEEEKPLVPAASGSGAPPPGNSQAAAGTSGDVEMGGVTDDQPSHSGEQLGEDWVMVNKDDNNNKGAAPKANPATSGAPLTGTVSAGNSGKAADGVTPGNSAALETSEVLETSNFDDAAGFSHIDSAGEALAAYDDNTGLDLGGLDNSAFGDAFHASEGEHQHHDTEDMA